MKRCRLLSLVAVIPALLTAAVAEEEKTKLFPSGHWVAWLHIEVPVRFTLDPQSYQGERKWWAKLDDPDSDLSVEVCSYGYISELDLLLTIPGVTYQNYEEKLGRNDPGSEGPSMEKLIAAKAVHKNAGDYFKAEMLPKDTPSTKVHGYERFIHRGKDQVQVYFLRETAYSQTYGNLYKTLRFTFPEGQYETHRTMIDRIIASTEKTLKPEAEEEVNGEDPGKPDAGKDPGLKD